MEYNFVYKLVYLRYLGLNNFSFLQIKYCLNIIYIFTEKIMKTDFFIFY